ncbi:MAG: hypothetical protein RJA67_233 [Bacteroidota bacterium]|jgi:hypothetical protein
MEGGNANGLWGSEGRNTLNKNKKPLDLRPGVFVLFFCFLEADTTKW